MSNRFFIIMALTIIFVFSSCEESMMMMPELTHEPTEVTEPEPFEVIYEPEEPSTETPAIEPQIITVRNMITHENDNPKWQGINWVYGTERLKTIVIVDRNIEPDLDGVDDGFTVRNFINGMILPPTKLDFEGYKYFPFKDGTDNFTIVVGDEIEIIQHKIGERYFRVLRNITRPEVDYSILSC